MKTHYKSGVYPATLQLLVQDNVYYVKSCIMHTLRKNHKYHKVVRVVKSSFFFGIMLNEVLL